MSWSKTRAAEMTDDPLVPFVKQVRISGSGCIRGDSEKKAVRKLVEQREAELQKDVMHYSEGTAEIVRFQTLRMLKMTDADDYTVMCEARLPADRHWLWRLETERAWDQAKLRELQHPEIYAEPPR